MPYNFDKMIRKKEEELRKLKRNVKKVFYGLFIYLYFSMLRNESKRKKKLKSRKKREDEMGIYRMNKMKKPESFILLKDF